MTVLEPTDETARQHVDIAANGGDGSADGESYWRYKLSALISPGALALAAFALATSGFFVLLGPLALVASFTPSDQGPVESAQYYAYIGIGGGIVAIALALWSLLRPESGPKWPRLVAGAAAMLSLIVIVQYAVVLITAANANPLNFSGQ